MAPKDKDSAKAAQQRLERATDQWRAAKKKERAARDDLAVVVRATVRAGHMTESKIATQTGIPRMTIRKMLGKE